MTHARLVLGALGAAALVATGCGSSSGGSADKAPVKAAAKTASAAAGPTKADYVRRADAVCRDARVIGRRANVAVSQAFTARKPQDAAKAIEHFAPAFGAQVHRLQRLPRPKGDQHVLGNLMKVMDAQLSALGLEAEALRKNDAQGLQQIAVAQRQALAAAESLGRSYGFKICGRVA